LRRASWGASIAGMNLPSRRAIAEKIRTNVPVSMDNFKEFEDLLALLGRWESGTVSGIPVDLPPLDPCRPSGSVPNNEAV